MEQNEKSKLLNDSTISKRITKKWIKVNDLSSRQYYVNKSIRFKASIVRSNLRDYIDAYIVVKGAITAEGNNDDKSRNEKLIFKHIALFKSCI